MQSPLSDSKRLVVVGGGAAGFFCAVNAARMAPGLEVILLEKTSKVLSKVRVSGGGRCNVTHACETVADMVRCYPRGGHFLKKAFSRYFTTQTIAWFQERGVQLKTEADGRMFPVSDSSATIIDCLVKEARDQNVQLRLNRDVKAVERLEGGRFRVLTAGDPPMETDALVIACGGFPKVGQFAWLEALGHSVNPPLPSLFTFNMPGNPITELMGVTVPEVQVKVAGSKLADNGPILITHWGASGPAVLKLSAWGAAELASRDYTFTLLIHWVPAFNRDQIQALFQEFRRTSGAQAVWNKNTFGLPQRLWQFLCRQAEIGETTRWGDLPAGAQRELIKHLCGHELPVRGKTTFKEEFVTCGGIKLPEVDPATMMSRLVPHLYFAGEILDVDGITGGYNFQHAWTSGYLAGAAISAAFGADRHLMGAN